MNKGELQKEMSELAKKHAALKSQLNEIEKEEKLIAVFKEFGDYKFKVGTYGTLMSKESITEVTMEDLKRASWGFGMVFVEYPGGMYGGNSFLLLKNKDEYDYYEKIFKVLELVRDIQEPCNGDKASILQRRIRNLAELYNLLK